jgi:pentose-5-phosphate-3-epimerase
MVSEPAKWLKDFHAAGASQITFHIEAVGETLLLSLPLLLLRLRLGFHSPSHPALWLMCMLLFASCAADADAAIALAEDIRRLGMRAGIALKPATPVSSILSVVPSLDMVLIMTVEPGFGGQSFMADMMPKVKELRAAFPHIDIQVDGGLSPKTIDAAAEAGANVIVAGTAVFKADDRAAAIDALRKPVVAAISG